MLLNYEKLDNGVIKQKQVNKINYDLQYIYKSYDSYGNIVDNMSHLRLGYLLGIIGSIPNSILDVGYGNGNFLKTCKNIIPNCYGNDLSGYPIPKDCEFKTNIYTDEYDVVCFFDVLEHFDNIYDISNLKTKYIYISGPECHYFSDEWFENWKHRKENEHLWHFNKTSLNNFMNELGYKNLSFSNIEDIIRKPIDNNSNI